MVGPTHDCLSVFYQSEVFISLCWTCELLGQQSVCSRQFTTITQNCVSRGYYVKLPSCGWERHAAFKKRRLFFISIILKLQLSGTYSAACCNSITLIWDIIWLRTGQRNLSFAHLKPVCVCSISEWLLLYCKQWLFEHIHVK